MRHVTRLSCLGFLTLMGCIDADQGVPGVHPDASAIVHEDARVPDGAPLDAAPGDAVAAPDALAEDADVDAGVPDSGEADAAIADAGTSSATWQRPNCGTVQGTAGVTFTFDEGHTLTPTAQMLSGVAYTYGLAALQQPGVILAVHAEVLLRSTDAGCTWTAVGPMPGGFPVTLAAAGWDRAYAWSENNRELYRIDGTTITPLTSPVDNVMGFAVDRQDPDHIRLGGPDGQIYTSTTAGIGRFSALGAAAFPGNPLVYRVAFDPRDLDHAAAGSANGGAVWTEDGGQTWTPVQGLSLNSPRGGHANVFSIAYSPASQDVIWFEGIDLADTTGGPGQGRHIWRSTNGGRSASSMVTQSATVTLTNGILLAPHPREPNLLYFTFGTYFQGYGTDLFRLDAASMSLSVEHNSYHSIDAIDFAPHDPSVMYLGLTHEEIR